jgi:hypothetical protein
MSDFPEGPLTGSVLALERMLSNCEAFRTRVGAATVAAALPHIHLFGYEDDPADIQAARPFASIWLADQWTLDQYAGGQRISMTCAGQLVLLLTDTDRHQTDRRASGMDFCGFVDKVLLFLKDHSNDEADAGGGVYLSINRLSFLVGPRHSATKDEASEGSYWHTAILIECN